MFSCDEVAKQLSDALDGELPVLTRVRIRLHLMMCGPCASMERSLRRTVEALRALGAARSAEQGVEFAAGPAVEPAPERKRADRETDRGSGA